MANYDVIVVGAGNAAQAAAMSALENGAKRVAILEKANEDMRGGNTHWSGGILRIAFDDSRELAPFLPGVENEYLNFYDGIKPYTKKKYMEDLLRVTSGRSDPTLANILVNNSYNTLKWAVDTAKIECEPACHVCGVQVNGQWTFPGGVVIRAKHEGKGLSAAWFKATKNAGIDIRYGSGALKLIQNDKGKVVGVITKEDDGIKTLYANAVVLGCGGFEANSQMRAQYLGAPWDTAKVRGTSFNQGDGLNMALSIGAMPFGQWTGRHATPIDANWPSHADRKRGDQSNRLSYSFGIIINRDGLRFVDEGEDTKLYTYAKFGAEMLKQPGGIAYQIFDQKTVQHLEPRYKTGQSIEADTIEELVELMDIENKEQALKTIEKFNFCANSANNFDPTCKDGLSTNGLDLPKSNWAIKIDEPPFIAYPTTGGITFTFGGLKIDENAQVIGTDWRPIPGLFTCGEMVGGLFHDNYPGGSGLISGQVFGKIAGKNAASEC